MVTQNTVCPKFILSMKRNCHHYEIHWDKKLRVQTCMYKFHNFQQDFQCNASSWIYKIISSKQINKHHAKNCRCRCSIFYASTAILHDIAIIPLNVLRWNAVVRYCGYITTVSNQYIIIWYENSYAYSFQHSINAIWMADEYMSRFWYAYNAPD